MEKQITNKSREVVRRLSHHVMEDTGGGPELEKYIAEKIVRESMNDMCQRIIDEKYAIAKRLDTVRKALLILETEVSVEKKVYNVAVPIDSILGRAREALGGMEHLLLPPIADKFK